MSLKRLQYLFYDRTIVLEKEYFPLKDVELLAQTALRLSKQDYKVELFASVSNAYLKFRLNDSHTFQLQMRRGANEEPFIVVQFGPYDPNYDLKVIRPIFEQTELLRDFPRFGRMAYYHRLSDIDEEMISFMCTIIVLLHQVFNNNTVILGQDTTTKRDNHISWLRNRQK